MEMLNTHWYEREIERVTFMSDVELTGCWSNHQQSKNNNLLHFDSYSLEIGKYLDK